jgi:hypothetical protein
MSEIFKGAIQGVVVSVLLWGTSLGLHDDPRFAPPPGPAIPIRCVEWPNYVVSQPTPVWCCGDQSCTLRDVV